MVHRLIKPCTRVRIDGQEYEINTDFKVWMEIEQIFFDREISDETRLAEILVLAYPVLPPSPIEAVRRLLWFYSGGDEDGRVSGAETAEIRLPLYNLMRDFDYIWASFLSEFGIDLTKEPLHWWKFKTLLGCLGENTQFARVVGYRCMDISAIKDKSAKRFYEKMKKKYSIPLDEASRQQKLADSLGALF